MKYGVGGINIDECRVGEEEISTHNAPKGTFAGGDWERGSDTSEYKSHEGRFPANVIHDGSEEVISKFPYSKSEGGSSFNKKCENGENSMFGMKQLVKDVNYHDEGSASRFFYCAKASKFDRDEGLDEFEEKKCSMLASNDNIDKDGNFTGMLAGRNTVKRNVHPTVKPTELMRYLVRLVSPKGATILDCFNGSGSTGKAVMLENKQYNKDYKYIGIELTEEYLPIAKTRIEYICNNEFDFTKEKREVVKETKKTEEKNGVEFVDLFGVD